MKLSKVKFRFVILNLFQNLFRLIINTLRCRTKFSMTLISANFCQLRLKRELFLFFWGKCKYLE